MFDLEFIKIITSVLKLFEDGAKTHYKVYNTKKELENLQNKVEDVNDPLMIANTDFLEWIVNRYVNLDMKKNCKFSNLLPIQYYNKEKK